MGSMKPERAKLIQLSAIADFLREQLPDCASAALVGSAAVRGYEKAADLDVTGFAWAVPLGAEQHHNFTYDGTPMHAVIYHPDYFPALCLRPDLILAYLREIRKLLEGKILFDDDGSLGRVLASLRTVSIPREVLLPFVSAAQGFAADEETSQRNRLRFYYAVENLAFVWMNSNLNYRYSKPKWLLEDSKLVNSPHLFNLLKSISLEMSGAVNVPDLVTQLRSNLDSKKNAEIPGGVYFHLKDAESLIKQGMILEAVWPLRMSIYQYCQWLAKQLTISYKDLRSIEQVLEALDSTEPRLRSLFASALLIAEPITKSLLDLWLLALGGFLVIWNEGTSQHEASL